MVELEHLNYHESDDTSIQLVSPFSLTEPKFSKDESRLGLVFFCLSHFYWFILRAKNGQMID